jgi:hypothetical protein
MKTSDITIVFQGAFKRYTQREATPIREVLKLTRRTLPGSRIVLSAWEGCDLPDRLPVDLVVLSPDPGPLAPLKLSDNKPNNVNRQIASTAAGLAVVRTPFALKMRTDCFLEHAGFIDFYEALLRRQRHGHDRRIVTTAFFTLDPAVFERIPYHVSDWFQFGRTEVLQSYWDAPPVTPAQARHYESRPHAQGSNVFEKRFRAQFAAEQHVCMHYARKLGYAAPGHLNDVSPEVMRDYMRFLAQETLVLDPWQAGLVFPKYRWVNQSVLQGINNFMHLDWLALTGQPALDDVEPAMLEQAMARRARLKRVAGWLFRASRPAHGLLFELTPRGNFVRRQAMRLFRFLRGLAGA